MGSLPIVGLGTVVVITGTAAVGIQLSPFHSGNLVSGTWVMRLEYFGSRSAEQDSHRYLCFQFATNTSLASTPKKELVVNAFPTQSPPSRS